MNHTTRKLPQTFVMTASALAVTLMLAACGGGSSTPPVVADTTLPTMSVTSNAPATGATGPVTYTITSSEAVTFNIANVTVTGGTKGALTVVDATHATFTVTPTPNAAGSMTVAFGAGVAVDSSSNASAANTSAAPAVTFNTIPVGSGNTGACATTAAVNCLNFDEAAVAYEAFEGLDSATQAADPKNAANKVGKFVKVPGGQPWAGATIYTTAANKSMPIVGLSTSKVVTLRVYSPAIGVPIMMKLEEAGGSGFVEKSVNTTKANEWETLSFDFTTPSNGTYSAATGYNKISLFPNFLVAETAAKTYYFDELKYAVGTPPAAAPLVFANNYAGATEAAWASAQGGSVGRYIDNAVATQDWWSGVAAVTDTVRSFYFGYGVNGTSALTKPWGFGAFVKAPANGSANVNAYSNVNVSVWGNSELFNTRPNVTLILKGAAAAGCTPEIQGTVASTSINATSYVIPKSSFTVKTACGALSSTASIWNAGVNEVHFQVLGNQVQYVTTAGAPWYANGLNIGPIIFQ